MAEEDLLKKFLQFAAVVAVLAACCMGCAAVGVDQYGRPVGVYPVGQVYTPSVYIPPPVVYAPPAYYYTPPVVVPYYYGRGYHGGGHHHHRR